MIIVGFIITIIFFGVGEYNSKLYANTHLYRYMVYAMIGYFIESLAFMPTLSRMNSLSILGTMWNLSHGFITLFLGFVIFHESIIATQIAGLILGMIAIVLLAI